MEMVLCCMVSRNPLSWPQHLLGRIGTQQADQLHHGPNSIPVCTWVPTSSRPSPGEGVFLPSVQTFIRGCCSTWYQARVSLLHASQR